MSHSRSNSWSYLVSFGMTMLLRHGKSNDDGDPAILNEDGTMSLSRLVRYRGMRILGVTEKDILEILDSNSQRQKRRFETVTMPDGSPGVRAAQGHSGAAAAQISSGLFQEPYGPDHRRWQPVALHGTSRGTVPVILAEGLRPGGARGASSRQDVHMVNAVNQTGETSGVRGNSTAIVRVDVAKMYERGMKMFYSSQGVILSQGDPALTA